MKCIIISDENFDEIKKEVNRKTAWLMRLQMKTANRLDVKLYFIPAYHFPECAGIPYNFVVSEEFIQKHFIVVGYLQPDTNWMYIVPKQKQLIEGAVPDDPQDPALRGLGAGRPRIRHTPPARVHDRRDGGHVGSKPRHLRLLGQH